MIFTAIDDNDLAWHEMLVPFMLSLRHTTYDGRVGVVDYGLSAEKLEVLNRQDIVIVPPARKSILACDRYLSVANYVADHDIARAAVYDADIWFQPGQFDLFDQIADPARMYAAPDAWFCDFVERSITGPNSEYFIDLGVRSVREGLGVGLQAGLLAGHREAWSHFGHFINDCIDRIHTDFNITYGIDTTFVNIYYGLGNLLLFDKIYNHVSKWGIHETNKFSHPINNKNISFASGGTRIQAMHMTGDVRYEPCWRYHNVYSHVILDEGRQYLVGSDKVRCVDAPMAFDPADFDWEDIGLRLSEAAGDGKLVTSPDLFSTLFGPGSGRAFWAIGSTRLTFEARRPISLDLMTTYPFGAPTPEKISLGWQDQTIAMDYPADTTFTLDTGGTFRLETTSLCRDTSRMAWGLRGR
jgi:hypothetical protein